MKLPQGITSVTTEDFGVGDLLCVRMSNGMVVLIDALSLGADHECQIGLYGNDWIENLIAGIEFDNKREAVVAAYTGARYAGRTPTL